MAWTASWSAGLCISLHLEHVMLQHVVSHIGIAEAAEKLSRLLIDRQSLETTMSGIDEVAYRLLRSV